MLAQAEELRRSGKGLRAVPPTPPCVCGYPALPWGLTVLTWHCFWSHLPWPRDGRVLWAAPRAVVLQEMGSRSCCLCAWHCTATHLGSQASQPCGTGKQDLVPSHWAGVGPWEHHRPCAAFS